jgi:hypothetical protein
MVVLSIAGPSMRDEMALRDSLSRVHPRMRASWLKERGLDDSYYTIFHRPENTGLVCVGRWPWGPSWELAGRDTFLYLGSGSGVRILSIADSVQPRMLGQINARSLVSQVVVQDSLLFVACGSWGAQMYSVSDPANPRELGSMDAVIGDLCVKDTFCYTVGGDSFRIYNVASPTQPAQLSAIRDSGDVLVEANGYAYVGCGASGTALNVYDVRDPRTPTLVNTIGGVQLALFVRGNLLFRTSVQPSYFSILDISNPSSIHEVGRINGYGGVALCADDKYAYLSCTYDHYGLFVIDISDSSNPQLRDSLRPEGDGAYDSYVPRSDVYGYLAADYGGLVTVDMRNVNSISELWSGYKAHQALDVCVDGNLAYVANQCAGLRILGISDPTRPQTLGEYDTVGVLDVRSAVARDSFAFISWWGDRRRFLRVLDVTNPAEPAFAAEESCFNNPSDWVLRDSLLYAAEANRFQVFNVAWPREPVRVGSCVSADMTSGGLAVTGNYAYVCSSLDGFQIVNIGDPTNPWVMHELPSLRTWGCEVVDTIAYVPCFDESLHIWSVANPYAPYQLGSVPTAGIGADVAVTGRYAYVGCSGIQAFDISNPRLPVAVGFASTPNWVRRVGCDSSHVYAACYDGGACIFDTFTTVVAESPQRPSAGPVLSVAGTVVSDNIRVRVKTKEARHIDIRLYDVSGREVLNVVVTARTAGCVLVDVSALPTGVYSGTASAGTETDRFRVVKIHRR